MINNSMRDFVKEIGLRPHFYATTPSGANWAMTI